MTKPTKLPPQKYLLDMFHYDNDVGKLFWSTAKGKRIKIGDEVGYTTSMGYLRASVDGISYFVHRIIWKMVHGIDPNSIDHINGDKSDNRIDNIRSIPNSENMKNKVKQNNNTSGVVGVGWVQNRRQWRAQIMIDKKTKHLGYFDDKQEAIKARENADIKYEFHKNHGRNHNG